LEKSLSNKRFNILPEKVENKSRRKADELFDQVKNDDQPI